MSYENLNQAIKRGYEKIALQKTEYAKKQEDRVTAIQRAARELKLNALGVFPDFVREFVSFDDFSENDLIIDPVGITQLRATISVEGIAPIRVFLALRSGHWQVGTFEGSYLVPIIYGSVLFAPAWDYHNGTQTVDLEIALATAYERGQKFGNLKAHEKQPEPQYENIND